MTENFQYLVPTTVLGAGGLSLNFGIERELSLTLVNLSSSTAITITLVDGNGRDQVYTVGAGLSYGPSVSTIRSWTISGNGATVAAIFTSAQTQVPVETLRAMVVNVSGTVNTDVGQGTQIAGGTTLQYGGTLIDPRSIRSLTSTDAQGALFTGGAAPDSGVWTLTVAGNGGTPNVKIGATTYVLASAALAVNQIATYTLSVVIGTTYTVGECVVLSGWISVT